MNQLLKTLPKEQRALLKKEAMPDWLVPMLATLTHDHFSDPHWIYEHKLDGQRCLIFRYGRRCTLRSRNKKSQNGFYPELVDALEELDKNCILDGEIVCYRHGLDSFSALQNRMHVTNPGKALMKKHPVHLYLFDILFLEGYNLTRLPLETRKQILKRTLDFKKPLIYLSHKGQHGEKFLEEACRKGWEGLIAKDAGSEYRHSRSKKWLKFKCARGQEFVIAGYTRPRGSRIGFGSLLIGYYEEGKLRYAGRVGTGFSDEFLAEFQKKLSRHQRQTCPFSDYREAEDDLTWVSPRFVGEVNFSEWTGDDRLRHPRFLGLRKDKDPKDVVRERARAVKD